MTETTTPTESTSTKAVEAADKPVAPPKGKTSPTLKERRAKVQETLKEQEENAPTELTLEQMTLAFRKLATLTGNANMLYEFGLTPWIPELKHMRKYHDS